MQIAKHFPLSFEVQLQLQINKTNIGSKGRLEPAQSQSKGAWQLLELSGKLVQELCKILSLLHTLKLRCKKSNEFKDRMQTLSWSRPHV